MMVIRRMMDHEIKDGKLLLKEDDILLYDWEDLQANPISRTIILMILTTIVVIVVLRAVL